MWRRGKGAPGADEDGRATETFAFYVIIRGAAPRTSKLLAVQDNREPGSRWRCSSGAPSRPPKSSCASSRRRLPVICASSASRLATAFAHRSAAAARSADPPPQSSVSPRTAPSSRRRWRLSLHRELQLQHLQLRGRRLASLAAASASFCACAASSRAGSGVPGGILAFLPLAAVAP